MRPQDQHGITNWIWFACERNEVPEFAQVIVVEWNRRFTRRIGDGGYNFATMGARIRLSIPLWSRASEQERRETVIHEACHCIVAYKYGHAPCHDSKWKEAMQKCGVKPQRMHNIDRTGLIRRQRRFILLDCPSAVEKRCWIDIRTYNLLQKGFELRCNKCGLVIVRNSPIKEDSAEGGVHHEANLHTTARDHGGELPA